MVEDRPTPDNSHDQRTIIQAATETVSVCTPGATLPPHELLQAPSNNPEGEFARLGAVLSAAERLAEDLEDSASVDGFDLVTALQCVLQQARVQFEKLEQSGVFIVARAAT